ncbi:IucA/IucC family protein [Paenibacillus sp. GD4]|uniref:IucA/IucC family protein n=1 Tax=Paenibacillus sp. GD4 TaxID=3068890 RepID=UPI002796BFB0|nr:IucA/IucC family protein [Paenibacillus sp. GD4]MDQ1914170.1 IucA/IucC family protein [Paenibacillus sp. GD4]
MSILQTKTPAGGGTLDARRIANRAALQSLINCILRETDMAAWVEQDGNINLRIDLPSQKGSIHASVAYKSSTGRHLIQFPVHWLNAQRELQTAEEPLLIRRLIQELQLKAPGASSRLAEELIESIEESCALTERIVAARAEDIQELYGWEGDFLTAEQALVFGHQLHPTPKSRSGISEEQLADYSPELKGRFKLHYFRAHRSIVREDSARKDLTATEWIASELRTALSSDGEFAEKLLELNEYAYIPLHPLQAQVLLAKPPVQMLLQEGLLQDVGPLGREFAATSSLRTVYHPQSRWMAKGSIPVRITNSVRSNRWKELERGVEVARLLQTAVGQVSERYPGFEVIRDPAYVSITLEGEEESGFEVVLRENPFYGDDRRHAAVVASLLQDPLPGAESRLGTIIRTLAEQEGRSTEEVSLDWFRLYLQLSLKPMLWLFMTYGIALEAHQQNSIVQLCGGYPSKYYYRDNQGYYFCESTKELLRQQLPDIGEKSFTFCEDAVADERFRYYLIFNHLFGIINGFGTAGLADEKQLLRQLREALKEFEPINRPSSRFLPSLLTEPQLPCKANLLTRLYDMDELVGTLENQSVYVLVENPLVTEVSCDE